MTPNDVVVVLSVFVLLAAYVCVVDFVVLVIDLWINPPLTYSEWVEEQEQSK